LEVNDELLAHTRQTGAIRAADGMDKHSAVT
jgi:hypothetical protein